MITSWVRSSNLGGLFIFRILGEEEEEKEEEKLIYHVPLDNITRQINLIGRHIADQGGIRVAVYLPNSVELLATLFACSFYSNLTTVLIPFDVSNDQLISMLRRSAADTVITAPGAFPLDAVVRAYPSLRQLIWVVDEGNNHMDWNEVPEGMGGSVNVATWQDIVRDAPAAAGAELPELDRENTPQDVVTFWQGKPGQVEEMVRFSQANLVAAISGQMFAVPSKEKFTSADLFLPADSLAHVHTLVLTLTALYQNASIALNSVTGGSDDTLDLELASRGIAPTVIVANPQTLLKLHENSMKRVSSGLARLSHSMATRAVVQEGVLAASGPWRSFNASAQPLLGTTPGKLRLVYAAERVAAGTPLLPAKVLSDLRILTGARVVYALTAPKVAGSVAQTAFYDYRVADGGKTHFGAPPTCVELLFRDMGENKTTDDRVEGEVSIFLQTFLVLHKMAL